MDAATADRSDVRTGLRAGAPLAVPGSPAVRLLRAQLVVDESWAIGHLGEGRFAPGRMLGAGLVL